MYKTTFTSRDLPVESSHFKVFCVFNDNTRALYFAIYVAFFIPFIHMLDFDFLEVTVVVKPKLSSYVFAKVLEDLDIVRIFLWDLLFFFYWWLF